MATNDVVAAPPLPRSLTDCMYFLNGNCKSGDKCRYRHCRAAGEQTKHCHKWPKSCKNVNCPYRHPSTLPKQPATPPPHVAQRQEGIIALFWDLENVSIPRTERPFDIVQRLRQELVIKPSLREIGFTCYCDSSSISQENQLSLCHANIRIAHVPDRKPGGVDRQILLDLDRFERAHKPPATIVLISGDIDFVGKLSDLRHQAGFHVIVVHNKPAKEELKATVNAHYRWDRFTSSDGSASTEVTNRNNLKKNKPQASGASAMDLKRECPICLKNDFNSLDALYKHQNAKQHFIECPECDDVFFSIQSQRQHHKDKHVDGHQALIDAFIHGLVPSLRGQKESEASVERLKCPQCSMNNFTSISGLQQHQQAKGHLYDCPECKQSYFTFKEQQHHQLEAHIDQTPSKEVIICRVCGPILPFTSMNALRQHIVMNGHGYSCTGCGINTFFTGNDLMQHVTTCIPAQEFLCPTCNELYCNKIGLRLHQEANNHFDRREERLTPTQSKSTRRQRK